MAKEERKGCSLLSSLFLAGLVAWYSWIALDRERFNGAEEKPAVTYTLPEKIQTQNGEIETSKIDFSGDFEVKTDRYRLVKGEDFIASRGIGWFNSLGMRLFFFDYQVSNGTDAERAKKTLALQESNKNIEGITIRLNHNEAFYDLYRLFTEKPLRERNNIVARVLMGVPSCLANEIWAEFARGDYYNPLTRTAVCYSNIESIIDHEIGHHEDHQRFNSDWWYSLARTIPGVAVYQEWKASKHADDKLSYNEKYQFYRYLIPALGTYVLATWAAIKKAGKRFLSDEEE